MSYRYRVFTPGDPEGACNALRFATSDECDSYGSDLLSRWFTPTHGESEECSDPVNYRWTEKGLEEVQV
jgi:hypothetical protein